MSIKEYILNRVTPGTGESDCSYKPDLTARVIFYANSNPAATDEENRRMKVMALNKGFTNTPMSNSVSINVCSDCQDCIPVRVCLKDFEPSRHQRRNLRLNRDLIAEFNPASAANFEEHVALYKRFFEARHRNPERMAGDENKKPFSEYLVRSSFTTRDLMIEIRDPSRPEDESLVAAIYCDEYIDEENRKKIAYGYGFSYDPELSKKRSLGTFVMLKLIEHLKECGVDYLHLGNWAKDSPKIDYKKNFRPLEAHTVDGWVPFDPEADLHPLRLQAKETLDLK